MLTQINISHFGIIQQLALEFNDGMTVITGETGAGKSIIIHALDIALGGRADPQLIRQGSDRADIHLMFDIRKIPAAQAWLNVHELSSDHDCIIRRQLLREGRSKCFINGHPVTGQQVRELASHLIHIHSQHQHYALLNRDTQRQMLDGLVKQTELLNQVKEAFYLWQGAQSALTRHLEQQVDPDRRAFLAYQVHELDELNMLPNEWETLSQQQQQLAYSETVLATLQESFNRIDGDNNNILQSLHRVMNDLTGIQKWLPNVNNCLSMLQNGAIQLQEALDELKDLLDSTTSDPQTLIHLEERMRLIHAAARRHQVMPEHLSAHQQTLKKQLEGLNEYDDRVIVLQEKVKMTWNEYHEVATQLHHIRLSAADGIAQEISQRIRQLGMPHGEFAIPIHLQDNAPTPYGFDQIEFQVNTNPGQPLMSMTKVASGGELSRISLAIQVMMATQGNTATLIFDEVDVGISGATAEIVGQLLRQLGQTTQVLCITHLPQVAAQGQHHIKITKKATETQTVSELDALNPAERIEEIARMVGGITITPQTRAYAEELLRN